MPTLWTKRVIGAGAVLAMLAVLAALALWAARRVGTEPPPDDAVGRPADAPEPGPPESRTPPRRADRPAAPDEPSPVPGTEPGPSDTRRPPGTCTIRVVRADDGEPVSGIAVGMETATGRVWLRADADGVCTSPVRDAPVTVFATPVDPVGGRRYVDASVVVPAGATSAALELVEGAPVSGRVVTPDGGALAGAPIEAWCDGRRTAHTTTDPSGAFTLRGPLGKSVELRLVDDPGLRNSMYRLCPWRAPAGAVASGQTDVVVRAERIAEDGAVVVRVLDPYGVGVVGAGVVPERAHPEPPVVLQGETAVTGPDGRVRLVRLLRRTLRITVTEPVLPAALPRDWIAPEPVEVVPDGQEVTVVFRPGRPVAGSVVTAEGDPVGGARVTVHGASPPGRAETTYGECTTDATGAFRVAIDPAVTEPLRVVAHVLHWPGRRPGSAEEERVEVTDVPPGATGVRIALRPR